MNECEMKMGTQNENVNDDNFRQGNHRERLNSKQL